MTVLFKSKSNMKRTAMFLAGFNLLLPFYLGVHSPNFAVKRFNIPESSVDLYISKLNNSIQLAYFFGMLVFNLYLLLFPIHLQSKNHLLSIGTNWLTAVSLILVLLGYCLKGEQGSLVLFYYMITLSSFIFGLNQGFVLNVGVSEIPWFVASVPMSGIFVVVYQIVYLFVSSSYNHSQVYFSIIVTQIVLSIVLTCTSSFLWTLSYMKVDEETSRRFSLQISIQSNFFNDLWRSKYPIILSVVGLGLVYGFYPALMPYKLSDINTAYRIDLLCVFSGGAVSFVLCLICELTRFGPNKNWRHTKSRWSYSLFLIAPYLVLPIFFIVPLHYPDLPFCKIILENKYLMGFLGLCFIMCHNLLTSIGYSAASMQTDNEYDGRISVVNVMLSYFVMIVVILYSQGYIRLHALYSASKDTWPTNDMNGFEAFFYWVGKSFVYGWKSFVSTSRTDIKNDILEVK